MMEIKMTMEGLDELRQAFEKAKEETKAKVREIVQQTTLRVHATSKKRIQRGPKTGIVYQKSDPSRTHQASKAGESPATDTGALVNSILWSYDDKQGGFVYTNLDYGRILEFGENGIDARPWLFPSLEEHTPDFRRALEEILK